jgi:hypothetical protein
VKIWRASVFERGFQFRDLRSRCGLTARDVI